jgi:tRNA A-37 threonylcarbamoyl transferase component Bud32
MSDDRPQPHVGSLRPSSVPPKAGIAAGLSVLNRPGEDLATFSSEPRGVVDQSVSDQSVSDQSVSDQSVSGQSSSDESPSDTSADRKTIEKIALDGGPVEPGRPERSLSPPGPHSDRYLGCTIDSRYKVEGIIGEGGMGVVYQCRHKIIDKRVALKILRADLARDAEVTERFLMEAKAASAIADEHIISISDFGQLPDGAAYFVMEFLEGTPLAQLAGGGRPMPLERILPIARQLAEGLGAAHQRGIVHRDLKPDNVFLIQRGKEADFVKILDFGIAKVSSTGGGRLTQAGSVFGTPHYMSPEQAAGTPLDQRGDIYSLGVMLYELATGRVPFDAENFVGILSQHLYQEPPAPRAAAPDAQIPEEFEAIILKCMAKKPEQRYQAMVQLRDDLWQLERRLIAQRTPDSTLAALQDPSASVEGTALSTELTLASLRPRRWPLIAAILAPIAVVSGVLAFELGGIGARAALQRTSSEATRSAPGAAVPAPLPAPAPPPAEPAAAAEHAPAVTPTRVLLGVTPPSAHVFLAGEDLGASPVSLDVSPGSVLTVELRHPNYATKSVPLDGSQSRVVVELDSKAKHKGHGKTRRGSAAAGSTAKPASSRPATNAHSTGDIGGQLFVEPWEKP